VRRSRNIGGGRALTTTDVGLAILRTLERISNTLDSIHDALQYSVSSLRLPFNPPVLNQVESPSTDRRGPR
jgi:transposase